jgi:hypothetical protein
MTLRDELLTKLLQGRCPDWPTCACARRALHWEHFDGKELTDDEVEDVQFMMIFTLHCIAKNCPDKQKRSEATVQLMHPIFAGGLAELIKGE